MKKGLLLGIIGAYGKQKSMWRSKNPIIVLLTAFLETENIALREDYEQVRFEEFKHYLIAKGKSKLTEQSRLTNQKLSTRLLQPFFFPPERPVQTSTLVNLTPSILPFLIDTYLDPKSVVSLSQTARAYDASVKTLRCWRHKLLALQVDNIVLSLLFAENIIKNYAIFYLILRRMSVIKQKAISNLSQLCYLSGEKRAILRAISLPDEESKLGIPPLLLTALSGSLDATLFVAKQTKCDMLIETSFGENLLLCGAYAGSIPIMRFSLKKLKHSANSRNVFHQNALHFATLSQNKQAVEYARDTLKLNLQSIDSYGRNAFLFCARSGSIGGMKIALDFLQNPINSQDKKRNNALHLAALSRSRKAFCFVEKKVSSDLNLIGQLNLDDVMPRKPEYITFNSSFD